MSAVAQKSFAAGEIAPSLYARTDISRYAIALRTCRNMMIMRHGGATNRPGSEYVCETRFNTKKIRLIPFVFNASQTYMLEVGDSYIRPLKSGALQFRASQTISGVTNASPAVLTYVGADTYAEGDDVVIAGVTGNMANYLNGRQFKVGTVDTILNTFQLKTIAGANVDSSAWGAYGAGGGTVAEIYQISSSYAEADLQELEFVQSGDTITIVHPNYPPAELVRSGDTTWTLTNITFAPTQAAPTNVVTSTAGGGATVTWAVIAVNSITGEESLAAITAAGANAEPTAGAPATITWTAATGAGYYRVFRSRYGTGGVPHGFIGTATASGFTDPGITPDYTDNPIIAATNPFSGANDYPSTVAYSQTRILYANTNNNPEKIWASQIGRFKNFSVGTPISDDDAVAFTMAGRQVNEVLHLLELGRALVMTAAAEWTIDGDSAGILTPSQINVRQHSLNGSSTVPPLIVGATALYLQARGNIVRDLAFDFQTDGYRGNDLTIFSAHLFDGHSIRDWTYQQIPQSVIWAVRDDGVLLGLTYVREQELLAWHHHDFQDAVVEQVCAIPEGLEDSVYVVVKRTIGSVVHRYVEVLATRTIDDIRDAIFMDCAGTYDGRNTGTTTMTLSGGTTWTEEDTLTLTASVGTFSSDDVGNRFDLEGSDGSIVRCTVTAYTSTTVISVKADKTVAATLRAIATTSWVRCVDQVTGLWYLEGEDLSVFGDGFVVASPNNLNENGATYPTVTVTNGVATLPKPYGVIQLGLPYISDLETLDIDTPQGESLSNKKKLITEVTAFVHDSRGVFAGPKPPSDDATNPLENLDELKIRNEEDYDDPVSLATENVNIILRGEYNQTGRVFVRQVDPLPMTVLSIVPTGFVPYQGGGG